MFNYQTLQLFYFLFSFPNLKFCFCYCLKKFYTTILILNMFCKTLKLVDFAKIHKRHYFFEKVMAQMIQMSRAK